MKFSELWLREWVNPNLTLEELGTVLTMAGLEVEELTPVAAFFSGVIIGQIAHVKKHPDADTLSICEVKIGAAHPLQIVCGASNVKINMKVAVAMIDAVLPNLMVTPATIRGVASHGMLCSASELTLADESQGILELPGDAPLGQDLWAYLQLQDKVVDLAITPNRGDCLSIRGIAREVSALTHVSLQPISIPTVPATIEDTVTVTLEAPEACPKYAGRLIKNVNVNTITPTWLKERLRRSGIRSINPIVDVTNYVMLELGQPMHAFDSDTIQRGIHVRWAKEGEQITLLDNSHHSLAPNTIVIADHIKPLAMAGVMGGLDSSVTLETNNILLESAYFSSQVIAEQRQHYGLNSDSAYRFERGVDFDIQSQAIERATQLILEITGGEAGPILEKTVAAHLPKRIPISLHKASVSNLLGVNIPDDDIENIFNRLSFSWQVILPNHGLSGWKVEIPSYRFDLSLSEDLIEEIARLYGYNKITPRTMKANLQANKGVDAQDWHRLRQGLTHQGFFEIISYSFISEKFQQLLDPEEKPRKLLNPMTADMAVMRTNLWPGLMNALLYNKSRQQHRIRLFEVGTCFVTRGDTLLQQPRVGGLITGPVFPLQWGMQEREADFYDLKGHLENLLRSSHPLKEFNFKPEVHPALHPGQTAAIYYHEVKLGILGAFHPRVLQALDLSCQVLAFELNLEMLKSAGLYRYAEISKFPEIRRDIALQVKQAIPAKAIQDTIREVAGDWLKEVVIFDLYQGKGIAPSFKSIALALILQHPTRTLIDEEVALVIERVITRLKEQLGATLRS